MEDSARFEYSVNFGHEGVGIADVLHDVVGEHHVERVVVIGDRPRGPHESRFIDLAVAKNRRIGVTSTHGPAVTPQIAQWKVIRPRVVPRAGAEIQDSHPWAQYPPQLLIKETCPTLAPVGIVTTVNMLRKAHQ